MLDRLLLTSERLKAIADDVRQVCHLEDPAGQVIDGRLLDSGLRLRTPPSPFRGCWRYFYEARPNVTIDVASFMLKNRECGYSPWRKRDSPY